MLVGAHYSPPSFPGIALSVPGAFQICAKPKKSPAGRQGKKNFVPHPNDFRVRDRSEKKERCYSLTVRLLPAVRPQKARMPMSTMNITRGMVQLVWMS